jgi:hypothetical protein
VADVEQCGDRGLSPSGGDDPDVERVAGAPHERGEQQEVALHAAGCGDAAEVDDAVVAPAQIAQQARDRRLRRVVVA